MSEIRSQATPARDELADVVIDTFFDATNVGEDAAAPTVDTGYAVADRLLAAGWSKPRTVNSATELAGLPKGTIIRDRLRGVCEIQGKAIFWIGTDVEENLQCVELPATVLFTPGEAG